MKNKKKIRKDALIQLKLDIKFGFDSKEEIFDNISFTFYEDEGFDECFDKQMLMKFISKHYNKHQKDSLNWEHPTDFDKLAKAFDELIRQKIICLHNVYNREDGESDCMYAFDMLSKKRIKVIGFCYYNSYDLEQVISSNEKSLFLEFKSLKLGIKEVSKVKNKIIRTLKINGLQSNISDFDSNVIEIKNVDWKKKPDTEDWWIDRVIHLLSHS
ncbi:DUF6891 domain-containing protein [Flavobacterium branchiicola]|uniref:DUF6891 domain-containing protein n=1 Tax=Flavobacterium branchiicola TaxID=1114875 RepID=A0ABV9PJ12_9FLAO|nr:hypothetical protein [Flavobacterium branchiicola]MBS7256768.1 hypothetical protein [Flavobacterium branchiicola]